jgi:hypothetical protein
MHFSNNFQRKFRAISKANNFIRATSRRNTERDSAGYHDARSRMLVRDFLRMSGIFRPIVIAERMIDLPLPVLPSEL